MSSGSSSGSSSSTITTLCYKIVEIREATSAEAAKGVTLYIKRADNDEEKVCSVDELSMYSMEQQELPDTDGRIKDVWHAFNTIAEFILSGRIKLSGGRDCFKMLASPQPGIRTLNAGEGIFFRPSQNISTYGQIYSRVEGQRVTNAHLSPKKYGRNRRVTNKIKLLKNTRYFIAGDSDESSGGEDRKPDRKPDRLSRWEMLLCHRGRLREAGIEVPGPIERKDLWLINPAGRWKGFQPLALRSICSNCLRCYANRQWPAIVDVCQGEPHCDNAWFEKCWDKKQAGWSCALAEAECAPYVQRIYNSRRSPFTPEDTEKVARVLNAGLTVHHWNHLSEMTGFIVSFLCLLFCSMPSLGERLQKRGASFVPWASDSGVYLGDYVEISMIGLERLYLATEDGVIDKHTGQKVKFEEDEKGIIRVTQVEEGNDDFSDCLPVPVSPSRFVRLG